mgnify:CR=1 FL=1
MLKLKRLLASTAIVAITASGAYAAEPAVQKDATAAPMTQHAGDYLAAIDVEAAFASKLIGLPVYGANNSEDAAAMPSQMDTQARNEAANPATDGTAVPADQNAAADPNAVPGNAAPADVAQDTRERIGDVNDLVVAKDGSIDAVVIGVGGFLGMGEKNVAVPFESLQWQTDEDGQPVLYLAATRDQLENAPEFDTASLDRKQPGDATMAPGDQAAPDTAARMPDTGRQDMAANDTGGNNMNTGDQANTNRMTTVDAAQISADDLIGTTVYDSANQNVGEVGDVILSQDGQIDAVVIDVGGFLGIGEKPVAISFADLEVRKDENNNLSVYSAFTEDQLNNAPEYDENTYATERDNMLLHM